MSHAQGLWHGYREGMEEEWYYCVEHDRVEAKFGCRITNRLGPYATREEAEQALEKVEQRNAEWEDDPDWQDDPWGDATDQDEERRDI
ncbi:MAG TPA: hypothetical protein VHL52_08040 [Acidimicrobiia bacterium]|nr:hypothetical protein [Acidimicrobiia bacterium]